MKNNLEKMITVCKQINARVVLLGILTPPNDGPKYTNSFNRYIWIYRKPIKHHSFHFFWMVWVVTVIWWLKMDCTQMWLRSLRYWRMFGRR